jgi:hypothetical protein
MEASGLAVDIDYLIKGELVSEDVVLGEEITGWLSEGVRPRNSQSDRVAAMWNQA